MSQAIFVTAPIAATLQRAAATSRAAPPSATMRSLASTRGSASASLRREVQLSGLSASRPRAARGPARVCAMASDEDGPEFSADAIEIGRKMYGDKDYEGALAMFEKALQLPGTGIKQFTDKPPATSPGERQTALYNIACCHSRLENERLGLVALAGCFDQGFEQFDLVTSSAELEFLRSAEKFEGLLGMYRRTATGGKVDQFGNEYARLGTPEEELVKDERTSMEKLMNGDWLWRALTKTSQVPIKKTTGIPMQKKE